MKSNSIKNLLPYLMALTCLAGIAYSSSQPFYEQDLRPEIGQYDKIMKGIKGMPEIRFHYGRQLVDSRRPADFIQFWIRKAGHVLSYGILGLSLAAILAGKGLTGVKRLLAASMLIILIASIDEWHQTFVFDRTGRAIDVELDLAGYLVLALIVWLGKQVTIKTRRPLSSA